MKRLIIAAAGLALVGGIIIGGIVGNPFGRSSASAATVGGRLISLGTISVVSGGTGEFPFVSVSDCARMTAMARAPIGIGAPLTFTYFESSTDGGTKLGLVPNTEGMAMTIDDGASVLTDVPNSLPYLQVRVINGNSGTPRDITGWIWCATSPSYAVGGVAEPPDFAAGSSGMGGAYAVLGAVGAVLAITAVGVAAKKRSER